MKQTTEAVVEIADRAMEAAEDAMQKCRAAAGKLLGQTICAIMEQEIMLQLRERRMADAHYANARNGYKRKTLTSNFGSIQTRVPQDRSSDYEPILIGKYRKDVRDIEGAIFRLYAGGKAARLTAAKALYGVLAKRELSEAIVNAIEPTACESWRFCAWIPPHMKRITRTARSPCSPAYPRAAARGFWRSPPPRTETAGASCSKH